MRILTLLVAASLSIAAFGISWAQTAPKPAAKPAAKPAPKPVAKAAPAKAPAAPAPLSSEQLSIAQIVTTGRIACGEGKSVTISPDAKLEGAFDLQFGSTRYDVVPMPTKSGAVRLEDTKTGVVFMQLANKSMLFNERQGKRLADDCISPAQQAVADQMKANPTPGVLEAVK